jgi:hypothetical protein
MENSTRKKIELKKEDIQHLSELSESGMGYQIVDITFQDGQRLKNRIVENSQFLLIDDDENIDALLINKIELKKNHVAD